MKAPNPNSRPIRGGEATGVKALEDWETDGGSLASESRLTAGLKDRSSTAYTVAMVGNHTPRLCGIATFTADLIEAIAAESTDLDCFVLAMNAPGRRPAYPKRVRFEISEGNPESYHRAADFLNVNGVDVVSLQHEYGIFGGKHGSHLLELLRELRMPIVTTLHTILSDPSPTQRAVMDEVIRLSERLVVMSEGGSDILRRVHKVSAGKIDLIPHGIPFLPEALESKERIGVEGKQAILTFGLLSPDKGIEHVIDALPAILEEFPNVTYMVVGATHPNVKERHGETYRLMLEARARKLGVHSSVVFYNRFVSHEELIAFLSAADVYITPYLNTEQITSGTLAYAIGSGKAVISTPYRYARELLAEGRGVLVPLRDSKSIANAAIELFADQEKRLEMCRRAASYGRHMTWPAVASSYTQSFHRARSEHAKRVRTRVQAKTLARRPADLPALNLDHLSLMTDSTGLLQHAEFGVPRYEDGYCLDDNARALIVMTLCEYAGTEDPRTLRLLTSRYSGFIRYAWNPKLGRFRNFMSYQREWQEEYGSEDSHGRALWALGTAVGRASDAGQRSLCGELFHAALPALTMFTSPRGWAYALLGIEEYLGAFQGDSAVESVMVILAERLLAIYKRTNEPEWPWFEDRLTYCNARLPQALLLSGARMNRKDMIETSIGSLQWLVSVQTSADGYFAPVGSKGFYRKAGSLARFDQQPIDALATISACLSAQRVTREEFWAVHARVAFDWYLGQNCLQQIIYDAATGGCRDGLEIDRVNQNQGAESTLSFLLSVLELRTQDRVVEQVGFRPAKRYSNTCDS